MSMSYFVHCQALSLISTFQMSSTNTTLATLAGGFVPMLLKNVLSSKGTKLSLKTISFKGQIDEIIDEYKQFWPVLDLSVQRDEPEVKISETEEEETEEGISNDDVVNYFNPAIVEYGEKGGKERNVKIKENGISKQIQLQGAGEKGGNKSDNSPGNGDKDKDKDKSDDDKKNEDFEHIIIEDSLFLGTVHQEDDAQLVDLFIDLSVADTAAGWSIGGSTESLHEENCMPPPSYDATTMKQIGENDALQPVNNNAGYRFYPTN